MVGFWSIYTIITQYTSIIVSENMKNHLAGVHPSSLLLIVDTFFILRAFVVGFVLLALTRFWTSFCRRKMSLVSASRAAVATASWRCLINAFRYSTGTRKQVTAVIIK